MVHYFTSTQPSCSNDSISLPYHPLIFPLYSQHETAPEVTPVLLPLTVRMPLGVSPTSPRHLVSDLDRGS